MLARRCKSSSSISVSMVAQGVLLVRFQLMLSCWKTDPQARPTFSQCKNVIYQVLKQRSPTDYRQVLSLIALPPSQSATAEPGQQPANDVSPADPATFPLVDVSVSPSPQGNGDLGHPSTSEEAACSSSNWTDGASSRNMPYHSPIIRETMEMKCLLDSATGD